MTVSSPFGRLIRKARVDADMTQRDMAKALCVSSSYLSACETGTRNVSPEFARKCFDILSPFLPTLETVLRAALKSNSGRKAEAARTIEDLRAEIEHLKSLLKEHEEQEA